jgi:hypothetical protein
MNQEMSQTTIKEGINMNKMKIALWSIFILISLSMISGLFLVSTSLTHADNNTHVIYLSEQTVQNTFISKSTQAINLGDRIIYTNNLFSNNNLVGHDSGYCEFVAVAPRAPEVLCMTTLLLDGSQLVTSSLFTAQDELAHLPIEYSILGGTGKFFDAHGVITRVESTAEWAKLTINMEW